MKTYDGVSIDIETLGVNQHAAILQIGAVAFNYDEEIDESNPALNVKISVGDILKLSRRDIDPDTLQFWLYQDDDVKDEVFGFGNDGVVLVKALDELTRFMSPGISGFDYNSIWARGPVFDIGILENAYDQMQLQHPWYKRFWMVRDLRTLEESVKLLYNVEAIAKDAYGLPHVAIDDAISQAMQIQSLMEVLKAASYQLDPSQIELDGPQPKRSFLDKLLRR